MAGYRLTAQEARDMMCIKKESFEKTLGTIRQMCDIAIREASRKGNGSAIFDVPRTMWGRDDYNHDLMGKALAEQLFDDDFDVTGTTARLIVSWEDPSGVEDKSRVGRSTVLRHADLAPKSIKSFAPAPAPAQSFSTAFATLLREPQNQKKKKVERRVNISSY